MDIIPDTIFQTDHYQLSERPRMLCSNQYFDKCSILLLERIDQCENCKPEFCIKIKIFKSVRKNEQKEFFKKQMRFLNTPPSQINYESLPKCKNSLLVARPTFLSKLVEFLVTDSRQNNGPTQNIMSLAEFIIGSLRN